MSCLFGDGECIPYFKRHIYQTGVQDLRMCLSMREFNRMCELAPDMSLWTKPDGLCAESGYNDTSLVLSSNVDKCIYYICCALSRGAEIGCPCNGTNCNIFTQDVCDNGSSYPYPNEGIIRPWMKQYYSWKQTWKTKTPTAYVIIGSFRCRGFMFLWRWRAASDSHLVPLHFQSPFWSGIFALRSHQKYEMLRHRTNIRPHVGMIRSLSMDGHMQFMTSVGTQAHVFHNIRLPSRRRWR
jgi:hypothetical protein